MHDTNKFSLDRIFFDRINLEANIWLFPKQCKVFYVPHFSQWETWGNGIWRGVHRPELDDEVALYLIHMGRFRLPSGIEHFLALGRVEKDCKTLLDNPKFMHMKKLGIEALPNGHPNLHAVPYPAWLRYNPSIEPLAGSIPPTVVVRSATFGATSQSHHCEPLLINDTLAQECTGKQSCMFHVLPAPAQIDGCSEITWTTKFITVHSARRSSLTSGSCDARDASFPRESRC
jgi:hypothetical protein